uniref:Uncharacterized protein n=1 Tax=Arundo donax TaxID=35708 RepID=A0A0A8ZK13_ARUDO
MVQNSRFFFGLVCWALG